MRIISRLMKDLRNRIFIEFFSQRNRIFSQEGIFVLSFLCELLEKL